MRRTLTPPQEVHFRQQGFRGMRDVIHPAEGESDMPMVVHNMISTDPVGGGDLVTRPPWQKLGTAPDGASCQLAYNYDRLDGVSDTLIVVSGAIYVWVPNVWSVYISAAQLAAAGIVLSTTNSRIFAVTLGGKLVISDGTNTPFMYDGVTATLTKLVNCPVLSGQPTVYYAKLFGIKSTDRSTFVWSEENDATIGYEAGGFNNAWTLGQTGSSPLTRLMGTNQGLYYWRKYSTGIIRGAVTTDFVNDGVHDGVSGSVGTTTQSMALVDNTIYWFSATGRPYCLEIGGDIVSLGGQLARKFGHANVDDAVYSSSGRSYGDGYKFDVRSTSIGNGFVAHYQYLGLVVFGYPLLAGFSGQGDSGARTDSSGRVEYLVCFHHRTKSLQAYWTFPVESGSYGSYFATMTFHVQGGPSDTEQGLFVFSHGAGISTGNFAYFMSSRYTYNLDDNLVAGAQFPTSPPQYVIGPPQGQSDEVTVAFDRLDVTVGARVKTTAPAGGRTYEAQLGAALQTSNRQVSDELSAPLYSGDAALFPGGGTGQVDSLGNIRFLRSSFGLAEEGLWARVLLRLDNSVNQGGAFVSFISGWVLTARPRTRIPATNITPP